MATQLPPGESKRAISTKLGYVRLHGVNLKSMVRTSSTMVSSKILFDDCQREVDESLG
jgi:hypothetical protein